MGLELAQMFARLGVKVTVLEALLRVVPAKDPAVGDGEQLLVATGRRPNTRGLGLEAIDVYAAGDVLGDPMFVYVAAYGGTVAAENALNGNSRRYDLSALPKVTFTDPAVASVRLTEDEARSRGIEPLVAQLPLEHVSRALAARDTRAFVKLVADTASLKLIGAHILATEAGRRSTWTWRSSPAARSGRDRAHHVFLAPWWTGAVLPPQSVLT